MDKDIAILLAWPETACKQAGAWYDPIMSALNVNQNGYYKVGHAAIVLIDHTTGECHYFDFGRYHSPQGFGRVRNKETDHDLELSTCICFGINGEPTNLTSLLAELQENDACHGDGELHAGLSSIDFEKAYCKAKEMQKREFIPYGPFVKNGSNCSRFVQVAALSGMRLSLEKVGLMLPLTLTPTPKWNTRVTKRSLLKELKKSESYETQIA